MDKIVLITDRPEECETLISCIKIMFPECEIQIQPRHTTVLQRASLASGPSTEQ